MLPSAWTSDANGVFKQVVNNTCPAPDREWGSSKISHPCRISTPHVVTPVANDSRFDQPHTVRFTLSCEGQLLGLRLIAEDRENNRSARSLIGCAEHQGLAAWLAAHPTFRV